MADLERRGLGLGVRPALVVVDMSYGFADPESPLGTDCEDVIAANKKLLAAFRRRNLPIFYTTVVYRDDNQARVFRARLPALDVLTPGSRWVEIIEELRPGPDDTVVEKCWASGFFATNLIRGVRRAAADSLVITGLTTSGCVRATVVDGLQHDFPVIVPREACGDRNQEAHAANLHDLHAKYADVMSIEDVIEKLQSLPA
jgi:nicotinamidase-related amidase